MAEPFDEAQALIDRLGIKCEGCGTSYSLAALHAKGGVSCCPERKMRAPLPQWVDDFLNRRTEVENVLLDVYKGKRPPLSTDEYKDIADKLGVPSEYSVTYRPAYQAPHDVAEAIAKAIEPGSKQRPSGSYRTLQWAAQVARSLYPRPHL